jgi:hypothetical protein
MSEISSYPKIHNIGHPEIMDMFDEVVLCEEKVDGSQISFGLLPTDPYPLMGAHTYELVIRSKRQEIHVNAPEKMFERAVQVILAIKDELEPGWIYRGEYLQKPKHNALTYNRAPDNNIIIFDVETSPNRFMSWPDKYEEAKRIGLECVPMVFFGLIDSAEQFLTMLETESILGGVKVEGVVAKNYARFGRDDKVLMAKYVSEAFKEVHNKEWKTANPAAKDFMRDLIESLRTEARWHKAVQHLREEGKLTDSPKDIGNLMKEVKDDLAKEEMEQIKDLLWKHFSGKILRGAAAGLAEWYKEQLVAKQFDKEEEE